jgi:DNA-binding Lrp family transcriptional regulator
MLDVVNQHVAKFVLASEDGDSINRIAEKIGASYGWTHKWVTQLEEIGVVDRRDGVVITDNDFAAAFETAAKTVIRRGIELDDAYLLPNFAGMEYAYTKTDAVYVWTKGGYQIGRNQNDYPIFIDVVANEVDAWEEFFAEFGVDARIAERGGDGIYVVLFPQDDIEAEWVEHAAVTPLQDTIEWMQEHAANFQPAFEMIDEMYDVDLGVTYRERRRI